MKSSAVKRKLTDENDSGRDDLDCTGFGDDGNAERVEEFLGDVNGERQSCGKKIHFRIPLIKRSYGTKNLEGNKMVSKFQIYVD